MQIVPWTRGQGWVANSLQLLRLASLTPNQSHPHPDQRRPVRRHRGMNSCTGSLVFYKVLNLIDAIREEKIQWSNILRKCCIITFLLEMHSINLLRKAFNVKVCFILLNISQTFWPKKSYLGNNYYYTLENASLYFIKTSFQPLKNHIRLSLKTTCNQFFMISHKGGGMSLKLWYWKITKTLIFSDSSILILVLKKDLKK